MSLGLVSLGLYGTGGGAKRVQSIAATLTTQTVVVGVVTTQTRVTGVLTR